jgi:hypothetical protein
MGIMFVPMVMRVTAVLLLVVVVVVVVIITIAAATIASERDKYEAAQSEEISHSPDIQEFKEKKRALQTATNLSSCLWVLWACEWSCPSAAPWAAGLVNLPYCDNAFLRKSSCGEKSKS